MKRLTVVVLVSAIAGIALATWGGAASAREAEQTAKKPKLPALPANIKERGRFNIAVKCDSPPFGYIDVRGRNAGFDVEIARWFSRFAFGKPTRVNFTCVTTPSREPALTTDRVDMVIATFTYTPDRDTRIDFSRAYYKATGRFLVPNAAPDELLPQLAGKTVATTSGSIYDRWMKRCFPNTQPIVVDSVTNAVLAYNQGRADAVMFDDTSLALIAATDPSSKMTDDVFLEQPYGIGIKQGNVQLKRWVDARLNLMKQKDLFVPIIRNNIAPRFVPAFLKNSLRPNQDFKYRDPSLPSLDTVCP